MTLEQRDQVGNMLSNTGFVQIEVIYRKVVAAPPVNPISAKDIMQRV